MEPTIASRGQPCHGKPIWETKHSFAGPLASVPSQEEVQLGPDPGILAESSARVRLAPRPHIAADKAAEGGRPTGLRAFALQRVKIFSTANTTSAALPRA